jgi:hypothetical protein
MQRKKRKKPMIYLYICIVHRVVDTLVATTIAISSWDVHRVK